MAPRPTEITLVAKMMDPDMSDDAKELARNIIDALSENPDDLPVSENPNDAR